MQGTPAPKGSPKRSGRAGVLDAGQHVFPVFLAGCAMLAGLFLSATPVARAGGDDTKVSITPIIPPRPTQETRRSGAIRVDVNLVLIPVTVTDSYERPVQGLQKSDFHLFENGMERQISEFFSQETPISTGIVFDASGSMKGKMDQSLQAVREFLKMSMSGDEFFLTKFNDKPEPVSGFTSAIKDIEDSLSSIQPAGWTALCDAIYMGLHQMKRATHNRKVLLILSDGGDNNSRYTTRETMELVKETDVRIFSISILDRSPWLDTIAAESGGRAFRVHKIEELPDLVASLSAELHSEYVLGFSPLEPTNDGLYRKIRVELVP